MKPSDSSRYPTGNGLDVQSYGVMNFEQWLGVTDGEGGTNPWYEHRAETITRNYTSPEFLTDMFGGIEYTVTDNFTYRGQLNLKIWKATFKTSEQGKNLVYPTVFTSTIGLKNEWLQTGYSVDTMMYQTSSEWSTLLENNEASMVENKKMYEVNKTLYRIAQTCLATGNFKTIEGLTATDGEPTADQKYAYQKFRNAVRAYRMKWTTQSKGLMDNFQILFAPYAFEGALQSAGQVSITATPEQWAAYKNGQIVRWYGFDIREFEWLENNFFFNSSIEDPKTDQRLQPNATGEDFNFKDISAVLFVPGTVIRKCKRPFFLFEEYSNNGFIPAAWCGGANVLDLYRVWNFTLDVFVEPFKEAQNMVILKEAPNEGDILAARMELAKTYPGLYLGINPENGYMTGDGDGHNTKSMIAQWIAASHKYRYEDDALPLDSNIYGFKANWTNFNGITKHSVTGVKKAK